MQCGSHQLKSSKVVVYFSLEKLIHAALLAAQPVGHGLYPAVLHLSGLKRGGSGINRATEPDGRGRIVLGRVRGALVTSSPTLPSDRAGEGLVGSASASTSLPTVTSPSSSFTVRLAQPYQQLQRRGLNKRSYGRRSHTAPRPPDTNTTKLQS
ncbi:hypothetical protein UPYG_G00231280 [Umbra pygmaea]|uniref:Uncharacterized protein n=1 Tax=Umbra pygmaea TaxID=75934 RepID=A0ABD0WIB1_UMBPY